MEQFPHAGYDVIIPKQAFNEKQGVFLAPPQADDIPRQTAAGIRLVTRPFRALNAKDTNSLLMAFFSLLFHWPR